MLCVMRGAFWKAGNFAPSMIESTGVGVEGGSLFSVGPQRAVQSFRGPLKEAISCHLQMTGSATRLSRCFYNTHEGQPTERERGTVRAHCGVRESGEDRERARE